MASRRFFNRELSWLDFNARVLEEAADPANPLLERVRFVAIVSANLDEFSMVRVAGLKAAARGAGSPPDPSGMEASEALAAVSARMAALVAAQYDLLRDRLLPALAAQGISLAGPRQWLPADRRFLETHFGENLLPLLTPLGVEEGRDFPSTGNLRVHAAFALAREGDPEGRTELAIVQVPPNSESFLRLPGEGPGLRLALLDEVIESFGGRLFPGYTVVDSLLFRVARDADTGVDEDRDEDFVTAMEEILASRQNAAPARAVFAAANPAFADRLRAALGLGAGDIDLVPGPVDLRCLSELASSESLGGGPAFARLRYEPWPPVPALPVPEGSSIWEEIAKGDRLLHLPFDSFDPVLRLLDAAADDPAVLAVKMTLYRTSGNSPIVRALTRAARNGKQVAVVMELKARFDEERNIAWANRLEQAGAIVTRGVARLKVHAKALLVVRREDGGKVRRYLHLSTGNYNDRTARLYSDLSIFTCNEELCRDASAFFNMLTGYSAVRAFVRLVAAPFELRRFLVSLLEREMKRSTPESPGLVMAKLNALADPDLIEALYRAGAAGVRILLNVRGICLLVPGAPGLSENIEVRSIVGRYLEHARILLFRNGGSEEVYLSSADWMPRNLDRRVELLFPVLDPALRARARTILETCFRDEARARRLLPDGSWTKAPGAGFSAQEEFRRAALARREKEEDAPREDLVVRRLGRREGRGDWERRATDRSPAPRGEAD